MFIQLIVLVALALFLGAQSQAVVPQVKLCDYEECPSVSRIGLGTLHLGDKIGGLSDAIQINKWVKTGLDLGITLFDTADVS